MNEIEFPKMELHISGMSSDPEKRAREIKEMRMKAGLEEPDEEFLSKYGMPTHRPPADADAYNIDIYNGDITYFRTSNDTYLKFVREEGKGYKLIKENNRTVWKYVPGLIARYEYGDISGYKVKPGYFTDSYETVE